MNITRNTLSPQAVVSVVLSVFCFLGLARPISAQVGDPNLPGTIAWYAAKAKAEGKTAIDTGIAISPDFVDLSLETALQHYSVVLAQPLIARSYVEAGRSIVTWHKFRVLDIISHRDPKTFNFALGDIPEDIFPNELLPVRANEILILRGAGAVEVDGIVVSSSEKNGPEFSSPEPVLLFLTLDRDRQVAKLPLGGKGVFHITDQDEVRPLVDAGNPVAADIRSLHANSMRHLREFVGRINGKR